MLTEIAPNQLVRADGETLLQVRNTHRLHKPRVSVQSGQRPNQFDAGALLKADQANGKPTRICLEPEDTSGSVVQGKNSSIIM